VQNSPHKLDSVEILVDYMKKHSARPDSTIDAQVAEILVPLHDDPAVASQVSWNTYFAPQGLKSALMSIGEELDPEHLERVRNSRKVMFGDESTSARGVPLVLFSGPPGTGKTHAMRLLAAKSGLTAYKLDATKLSKDSYQAPHLWSRVLEQISQYPRAGVYATHLETTDAVWTAQRRAPQRGNSLLDNRPVTLYAVSTARHDVRDYDIFESGQPWWRPTPVNDGEYVGKLAYHRAWHNFRFNPWDTYGDRVRVCWSSGATEHESNA